MKYRYKRDKMLYNYLNEMHFVGKFNMPKIEPVVRCDILNLITINYTNVCPNPELYHLCFYIDDYQFERIWNAPQKSLQTLKRYKGIIAPDFSIYRDFPLPLKIYNCWRNKVLTVFYQSQGIEVIPNVQWCDESSYEWCFDGLPKNSILAVSTNGCLKDKVARALFISGFREMKKRLNPIKVIVVGKLPKELENEKDIIKFESYSSNFGNENKSLKFGGVT